MLGATISNFINQNVVKDSPLHNFLNAPETVQGAKLGGAAIAGVALYRFGSYIASSRTAQGLLAVGTVVAGLAYCTKVAFKLDADQNSNRTLVEKL